MGGRLPGGQVNDRLLEKHSKPPNFRNKKGATVDTPWQPLNKGTLV